MEQFAAISDVIWAAIVASLLTLGGVLLTNRHARKLQLAALEHEAKQRDRERDMMLRRDVYLRGTEGLYRLQQLLMKAADVRVSDDDLSREYTSGVMPVAAVYVVGSNATVQALHSFLLAFSAAYLEISTKRWSLTARKQQIESLDAESARTTQRGQRYVDVLTEANLAGRATEHLRKTVESYWTNEVVQQKRGDEEREQLQRDQAVEMVALLKLCSEKLLRVSELLPTAIFAVRAELEVPIDEAAFMADFRRQLDQGAALFERFLAELGKRLEEPSANRICSAERN